MISLELGQLIGIRRFMQMTVTELKRYQRRRYRLKQWWITERSGLGWGTRGRREKNGYNPMSFLDLEWE